MSPPVEGVSRMRHQLLAVVLGLVVACTVAEAQIEAITSDGRRVILEEDSTWRYAEEGEVAPSAAGPPPEEGHALLTVERVVSQPHACTLGLRLHNRLPYEVRNIVPQFSAYTADDVRYVTIFQSFTGLKPTDDQYREVTFPGRPCEQIARVQIHGADRCSMGDLDRFTATGGECLQRIVVAPSGRFNLSK
jgi:hypothetical protein